MDKAGFVFEQGVVADTATAFLDNGPAIIDRYLNHPAPGRKTNDFLYTSGLGITFAK